MPITVHEFQNYVAGQQRVAIKGNPNFGDIRTLMVGVKNGTRMTFVEKFGLTNYVYQIWIMKVVGQLL